MKLLLDTSIFLWAANDDTRLLSRHREAIEDVASEVYLSVVSIWEASVKYRLGKLPLLDVSHRFMPAARDRLLMISMDLDEVSVLELHNLPDHHQDPFNRMIICQARAHGLTLVTTDALSWHTRWRPCPRIYRGGGKFPLTAWLTSL